MIVNFDKIWVEIKFELLALLEYLVETCQEESESLRLEKPVISSKMSL